MEGESEDSAHVGAIGSNAKPMAQTCAVSSDLSQTSLHKVVVLRGED